MREERNFLELLDQEVEAYRKSLGQALKVSEELAGILEAAKKTHQGLEERLHGLQELVARGGEDLDRLRQEWEESRLGIEEWRRRLEEQVLEHIKESQNREQLVFIRLNRIEEQLGQQRTELEERLRGLEDEIDELGQRKAFWEESKKNPPFLGLLKSFGFRQERRESRFGTEEWRRKQEEQVPEHLKESQNRLSEIQHLIFKRLDRVEDQLGQQRAELERRMKGLENRMDEMGQQVNHMEQKLLARHLETMRKVRGLQRQIFVLGAIMGLLALGAYFWGG